MDVELRGDRRGVALVVKPGRQGLEQPLALGRRQRVERLQRACGQRAGESRSWSRISVGEMVVGAQQPGAGEAPSRRQARARAAPSAASGARRPAPTVGPSAAGSSPSACSSAGAATGAVGIGNDQPGAVGVGAGERVDVRAGG